jgi:hypothetical protein
MDDERIRAALLTPGIGQLLIPCHPLQVLPALATAIGLDEGIFLQQLHYWMLKSKNQRDGRFWVYNTYDEWQKQFPFWSTRTITRIVQSLKNKGLVITGNYNAYSIDRTTWYSIDYDKVAELPIGPLVGGPDSQVEPPTIEAIHDNMAPSAPADLRESSLDVANLARSHYANMAASIPETTPETTSPSQSLPSSVIAKESTSRKQRDLYASPFNAVPVMVDCDPDDNRPESTPPVQENVSQHQRMVQAICTVCVLDAKLYAPDGHREAGGKIGSIAKHLLSAGYTPEWIEKAFGHGGWWYYQHARGKSGQPPLPEMLWMNVQKAREALGA